MNLFVVGEQTPGILALREDEVGQLRVLVQPELHSKTLPQILKRYGIHVCVMLLCPLNENKCQLMKRRPCIWKITLRYIGGFGAWKKKKWYNYIIIAKINKNNGLKWKLTIVTSECKIISELFWYLLSYNLDSFNCEYV